MAIVPDTPENLQICICGDCPSYSQCMKDNMEGLYCGRSKSNCEFDKNGCLCGACLLTSEFELDKMYYCESGALE